MLNVPEPITIQLRPRGFIPVLVGAAIFGLLYYFRDLGGLFLTAFAMAYVLHPLVDRLEKLKVPRSLAIALVLLTVVAAVTLILWFVVPGILREITELMGALPRLIGEWQTSANNWLERHPNRHIPATTNAWMTQLGMRASEIAPRTIAALLSAAKATISVLEFALEVLVVLAMSSYLLQDWHALIKNTIEMVPLRAREGFASITSRLDANMGKFVRGQLLVMLILGTLYALGLSALRLPAGLGIGIMAGLISFVPYVGFLLSLCIAFILTVLDGGGTRHVLMVLGYMVSVHILDVLYLTPRILGGSLGLPPVVVILSLLAGAKIMGFSGLLVAIPVAAMARVILTEIMAYYRDSAFYRTPPSPPRAQESELRVSISPPPETPAP